MQKTEPLIHGNYYHIYNCGINGEALFRENSNYEYFLWLYEKHVTPVADTFAWCLMGNHFHFLVRIREVNEMAAPNNPDRVPNPVRVINTKPPHQYFSNLFNSYTQAFNKKYSRHGALFERPFKRKLIDNKGYFRQVVVYIHQNPVHHGFCEHPGEYGWSSYNTCVSNKPTRLERSVVLEWFGKKENFILLHEESINLMKLEEYLEIEQHYS
ncbi:MAG: hypothetical protein JXB00_20900 [Bacteroidales bacterium]|nr:hypothetical protein [Bacteroidales bacterium]